MVGDEVVIRNTTRYVEVLGIWLESTDETRRSATDIGQRNAWRHAGKGLAMPHIWIASNTKMSLFWMWSHETFCTKIAQHQNSKGPILAFQKDCEHDNFTIDELVERIVAWATEQGLKPKGTDSE